MRRLKDISQVTEEWINSIPKIINNNGCWIPDRYIPKERYTRVKIGCLRWLLHRLVMCLYYNIDYINYEIQTRHA